MDPRIRIRSQMSQIQNIGKKVNWFPFPLSVCEEGRQAPPAPWPALAPTLPHSRQSAPHTFVPFVRQPATRGV